MYVGSGILINKQVKNLLVDRNKGPKKKTDLKKKYDTKFHSKTNLVSIWDILSMNGHVMTTADYKQNGRIFLDSSVSNGGVRAGEHGCRNISEAEKKRGGGWSTV